MMYNIEFKHFSESYFCTVGGESEVGAQTSNIRSIRGHWVGGGGGGDKS